MSSINNWTLGNSIFQSKVSEYMYNKRAHRSSAQKVSFGRDYLPFMSKCY